MQVIGNQSSATQLLWYQDRTVQGLPTAWAISLPMWVYRAVMLLWSLWLVFALMKWGHWAWQSFSTGELWRQAEPVKRVQKAKPVTTVPITTAPITAAQENVTPNDDVLK
jgi:hypothetical protein